MAQTEEDRNRATQKLFTVPMSNFQGDPLRRIVSGSDFPPKVVDEPARDSEEVELSLGLSLNGRFGVDPRAKTALQLKRSSSISDLWPATAREEEEEEEEQTTCRIPRPCMVPLMRTCSLPTETEEEWRKRKELQSLRRMEAKRKRSEKQQRNSKLPRDRSRENFEEAINCPLPPLPLPLPPPESQGTVGSQGSGSSGITESDSQAAQGTLLVAFEFYVEQ